MIKEHVDAICLMPPLYVVEFSKNNFECFGKMCQIDQDYPHLAARLLMTIFRCFYGCTGLKKCSDCTVETTNAFLAVYL